MKRVPLEVLEDKFASACPPVVVQDAHAVFDAIKRIYAWQPISTAPKDGTHIVLLDKIYEEVGYWSSDAQEWRGAASYITPTHWLPLPPKPWSKR